MAKDPVCGMHVDETGAQIMSDHEGKTYYFCCAGCKRSFDESPEKYLEESLKAGGHDS
jgi:Cu+-exporting ATPase